MQMTESEITRSYRQADDKKAQIRILAELNACQREDIINILTAAGEIKALRKKAAPKEKIPKIRKTTVRRTRKSGGGVSEADTVYVSKEVSRILCEGVDSLEESLHRLEAEEKKIHLDIAKRKEEYRAYVEFIKRVKVKEVEE